MKLRFGDWAKIANACEHDPKFVRVVQERDESWRPTWIVWRCEQCFGTKVVEWCDARKAWVEIKSWEAGNGR